MAVPDFDGPVPDALEPYWEAIARGAVAYTRCSVCHEPCWYPLADSPCHPGAGLEWHQVRGVGSVWSFTAVQRDFLPSGAPAAPYLVGLVSLDAAPSVRVPALLGTEADATAPPAWLEVGAPVELDAVIAPSGRALPRFVARQTAP